MTLLRSMSGFIVVLIACIARDIISIIQNGKDTSFPYQKSVEDFDEEDSRPYWKPEEEGGPGSKISSPKIVGTSIKISYCSYSGYKNAFDQYSDFIMEKYPEIFVEGTVYPQSFSRTLGTQFLKSFKFLLLGVMLLNQWSVFRIVGFSSRSINWISDNKIYVALLSFFLINWIESQLASTGAFEIYIDDLPVWSGIQAHRLPNPAELIQMIENHLKLGKGFLEVHSQ